MSDPRMYDIAREVMDEFFGEGSYAEHNKGNPDPAVQRAINEPRPIFHEPPDPLPEVVYLARFVGDEARGPGRWWFVENPEAVSRLRDADYEVIEYVPRHV